MVGTVVSNEPLAENIFDMVISLSGQAPLAAKPGQFVGLYVGGGEHLLPRPISICEVFPEEKILRLVYKTVGKGTEIISCWKPGREVTLLGTLGNGFAVVPDAKLHIIVGGGVGIPPLLELTKQLTATGKKTAAFLGYADETFLTGDFKKYTNEVHIAADSGREGFKGNAVEMLAAAEISEKPNEIAMYACGPKPMLAALGKFADERGIPLQVSLEERMACGIGSCLCCAVEKNAAKDESSPKYLRVCKDGPVFDYRETNL